MLSMKNMMRLIHVAAMLVRSPKASKSGSYQSGRTLTGETIEVTELSNPGIC